MGQPDMSERMEQEPKEKEEESLEQLLAKVEDCIAQLEQPENTLEDSFRLYEWGVRQLKLCNEKVERIEKQMLVLNQEGQTEEL